MIYNKKAPISLYGRSFFKSVSMKRIAILSVSIMPKLLRSTLLLGTIFLFIQCDGSDNEEDKEPTRIIDVGSETCTLDQECSAGSFYVLNLGCVEEANAINSGNLLINPGFEADAFGGPFPTTAGGWSGDIVTRVGAEAGILPAEGDYMLSFDFTSNTSASTAMASEIAQIYVLPDETRSRINEGETITVRQEAFFNRVQGDENTDSQFLILLMAFDGPTEDFSEKFLDRNNQALALATTSIISDDCINSWEKVAAEIIIPRGTEYIGVLLAAAENIQNEGEDEIEFDGHYVDAASLYIVD